MTFTILTRTLEVSNSVTATSLGMGEQPPTPWPEYRNLSKGSYAKAAVASASARALVWLRARQCVGHSRRSLRISLPWPMATSERPLPDHSIHRIFKA